MSLRRLVAGFLLVAAALVVPPGVASAAAAPGDVVSARAVNAPSVTSWVADRLAGRATTGNC